MANAFINRCTELLGDLPTGDRSWDRYLRDHWADLRNDATSYELAGETEQQFRFRPSQFLVSRKLSAELLNVFLMLNGLSGPADFHGVRTLLLPNAAKVQELFRTYETVRRQAAALRSKLA